MKPKPTGQSLPANWPKWDRQCKHLSWRTGQQCKARAIRGTDGCRRHGGAGVNAVQGWKRYLLWVLLPESIRQTGIVTPVTDEEVEIVCQVLAHQILTGDQHASEAVRMRAIEYLFDVASREEHDDPAVLLTHLSREDADTAIGILRRNGLLR